MKKTKRTPRPKRSELCEKYPRVIFRVTKTQQSQIEALPKDERRKIPNMLRQQLSITLQHFCRASSGPVKAPQT